VLIGGRAAVNNKKRSASFMDKEAGCNLRKNVEEFGSEGLLE